MPDLPDGFSRVDEDTVLCMYCEAWTCSPDNIEQADQHADECEDRELIENRLDNLDDSQTSSVDEFLENF